MASERHIKKIKKRRKRVVSVIIVAAIVIIGYFAVNNQFIRGLYYNVNESASDSNSVISLNDNISTNFLRFKNLFVTVSGNNITAYDIKGEQVDLKKFSEVSLSVSHFNNLNLKACDDYIIAYDKGGFDIVVFNNKKISVSTGINSKLIFAKPFNNGEFLVIAEDANAKCQVKLYSSDGKEKFVWHSGVNSILDASYSYDTNKLAIITSELSTGMFNSKIVFFDITKNTPFSEMTFENTFFTNVNYYNKNNIVVLSDVGIYYFNNSGELVNSYNFNNKMLNCFKQMPNGVMALSFSSKSENETTVEIVGNKGNLIGAYSCEFAVNSIDANKDAILLCGLRKISLITKKGMLLRTIEHSKDLKKAFFLNNKFVLIANSEIRIVN